MPLAPLPTTELTASAGAIDAPAASGALAPAARGGAAVFAVLFLATLLNGVDASEFTSASTVIARELHLGIDAIGMLASAFTVFLTISIIPIGLWADRAPRSRVIAACLATWSMATALTSLATGFVGLLATRMLTGVGEAGYLPAGGALVRQSYPPERRAPVMSWLMLGGVAGPILGMVLGGVVAGAAPGAWRLLFLITGIPGLLLAFVAWRLRTPTRVSSAGDGPALGEFRPRAVAADLAALLRNPGLLVLLGIGVLTAFTSSALQSYFPTLLQQRDTFGFTSGQAGLFAGLVLGPVGLVGVVLGGYLAARLRRRGERANLLLTTMSVLVTAPLNLGALLTMTTHNVAVFAPFLVASFFVNTLHFGPFAAAVLDAVPAARCASATAVSVFVQRLLGTALAPLVVGGLAGSFDPTGLHFAQSLAGHDLILALIITCPAAYLGAGLLGILGLRLPRPAVGYSTRIGSPAAKATISSTVSR